MGSFEKLKVVADKIASHAVKQVNPKIKKAARIIFFVTHEEQRLKGLERILPKKV